MKPSAAVLAVLVALSFPAVAAEQEETFTIPEVGADYLDGKKLSKLMERSDPKAATNIGWLFARGEGVWASRAGIFFACTTGGPAGRGQIFRYVPSEREGQSGESVRPGTIELFLETDAASELHNPDNLTIAPWGDLFVCEDGGGNDV